MNITIYYYFFLRQKRTVYFWKTQKELYLTVYNEQWEYKLFYNKHIQIQFLYSLNVKTPVWNSHKNVSIPCLSQQLIALSRHPSCGGNQQQDTKIGFLAIQMPICPTFWNKIWSATTALWHLPGIRMLVLGNENGCRCQTRNSNHMQTK